LQAGRSSGALTELITTFNLSLTATVQEVCSAATRAELDTKSWNELVWSFEALKRWGDELENRFGTLIRIDHHSPPDDPPDITLHFARADIPWEHTLLEPYPLRWAQDIRGNRGGFVPPVGRKKWTRNELQDVVSGVNQLWGDMAESHETALSVLVAAVAKKLKSLPASGILVVDDRVTHYPSEREELVRQIHTRERDQLGDRLIIFFQRNNDLQFWSGLLSEKAVNIRVSKV
jgi:hypothetical protein